MKCFLSGLIKADSEPSYQVTSFKMNAITSLYIPCVEDVFNAEFIANAFDKLGIAKVSRIATEKSTDRGSKKYKRVYVGIKFWHDTEAAFNFIRRVRNPKIETRFVYQDDNWWPVEINRFPHKIDTSNKKRTLTIFNESDYVENELNLCEIIDGCIENEKTKMLKNIIANFPAMKKIYGENIIDNEFKREVVAHICGYKDADEMDVAETFDGYFREIEADREKWFSEQYIYDALCM